MLNSCKPRGSILTCHWRRSCVFINDFGQILHCFGVLIVDFEQVNPGLLTILQKISIIEASQDPE